MANATNKDWLQNLKAGDTVYYVGERGRSFEETVEKVGSKIIHTGFSKYLKENGRQQVSAGHIGQIYPNKEAYEEYAKLDGAWFKLRQRISSTYELPTDMTQEKMDQISAIIYGD